MIASMHLSNDPRITAITPTKRDPGRLMVRVAGKVVATMEARHIEALRLEVGQPWDDKLAGEVADSAAYDKAWRAAVRRIERRAMSRRRLADKLRKLEHERAVIDRVLDRMEELGVIDDAALGRQLAESWRRQGGAGPRMVTAKLQQRGIDRAIAEKIVAELYPPQDADLTADARRFAERKLRSMTRLEPIVRKRRLWGALARRGYDTDTINAAMKGLEGLS
jgi:regulatory protein